MENTVTREVCVKNIKIGAGHSFVLIAGPCVIENRDKAFELAEKIKKITEHLNIPFIFKASYDKANRSSIKSFRGPGLQKGLEILSEIKQQIDIPVLSDVHRFEEIDKAAEVLDVIQTPAFLCRQTDFVIEVAKKGKVVNIKKGQFMSPAEMKNVVEKAEYSGNSQIILTERGTSFGYNNLVVDMRSFEMMRETKCPVVFDATHSVQLPGGLGASSGGERNFVPSLARAAVAAGVDALFMEVHKQPDKALCDGPNSVKLSDLSIILRQLKYISEVHRI